MRARYLVVISAAPHAQPLFNLFGRLRNRTTTEPRLPVHIVNIDVNPSALWFFAVAQDEHLRLGQIKGWHGQKADLSLLTLTLTGAVRLLVTLTQTPRHRTVTAPEADLEIGHKKGVDPALDPPPFGPKGGSPL